MERKPIKRTNRGQYAECLDGMGEFAHEVAVKLCKKYPGVDFMDLQFVFERAFSFEMSVELVKYGSERNEDSNNDFYEACEKEEIEDMEDMDRDE